MEIALRAKFTTLIITAFLAVSQKCNSLSDLLKNKITSRASIETRDWYLLPSTAELPFNLRRRDNDGGVFGLIDKSGRRLLIANESEFHSNEKKIIAGPIPEKEYKLWLTDKLYLWERLKLTYSDKCNGMVEAPSASSTSPLKTYSDLKESLSKGRRMFQFTPHFGFGNIIGSTGCSLLYSIFTDRIVAMFPYDVKSLEMAGYAFESPMASIQLNSEEFNEFRNKMESSVYYESIHELIPSNEMTVRMEPGGKDGKNDFILYWQRNETIRDCFLDLFGCKTAWCVKQKLLVSVLGSRQSPALGESVQTHLKGVLYRRSSSDVWSIRVNGGRGLEVKFDFAIHVRTKRRSLEEREVSKCMQQTECKQQLAAEEETLLQMFLDPNYLSCIGTFIKKKLGVLKTALREGKSQRPPRIYLAVDFERLREGLVQYLQGWGDVFYSSAPIVHSHVTEYSLTEGLPTLADFFLISRGKFVLQANRIGFRSTFSEGAAMYGNRTLEGIRHALLPKCALVRHSNFRKRAKL